MYFSYGYPLFELEDEGRAYNYLRYGRNSKVIRSRDKNEYNFITSHRDTKDSLIVRANMKIVQDVSCSNLIPNLSATLNILGQKHEIVTFNPNAIIHTYNPIVQQKAVDKLIPYIFDKFNGMVAMWISFPNFAIDSLEQLIKSKYPEHLILDRNKAYIRLLPNDSFGFIYEFIDDIYSIC